MTKKDDINFDYTEEVWCQYKVVDTLSRTGLMSIFQTQKVKLFYAALLASNSH